MEFYSNLAYTIDIERQIPGLLHREVVAVMSNDDDIPEVILDGNVRVKFYVGWL